MTELNIEKLRTGRQLKQFINLPRKIYIDDPLWVPPLWLLERSDHNAKKNPVLKRSEHAMFIAYKNGQAAGRIIVYIDPRYNAYHKTKIGMFGSFECIDDPDTGKLLFSTAEAWLAERGMTKILGPINPIAESWGFLYENPTQPVFMSPHNPLYYNDIINSCGYSKAKDLLVYEADARKGYEIPERFINFSNKVLERRTNLSIRTIDRKNLHRDAVYIKELLNTAVAGNWGFVPVEEAEMEEVVDKLKLILDENTIYFVEDNGTPVGIALGFPDINMLFKQISGRLTPSGIITLLKGRKKIKDYRLWGLAVLPEYQGLGLDVLLYVSIASYLTPLGCRLEANYMLEDNPDILNALKKMNLSYVKKYRVYEKDICND